MKTWAALGVTLSLTAAYPGVAGTDDTALDHANQLRQSRQFAAAQTIVSGILSRDPSNFRANYDEALIQGDQGNIGSAIATLKKAIDALHGSVAPDLTIYNTLGWYLMQSGAYKEAEQWFSVAYTNRAGLKGPSLQRLLTNMGTLYALEGNRSAATRYFNEAAAAGSPTAAANLQKLVG